MLQVPYRLLKAFHKVQQRLVRELEKKFSGKDVVLIANRRVMPTPSSGKSIARPRSRTLTAVRLQIPRSCCLSPCQVMAVWGQLPSAFPQHWLSAPVSANMALLCCGTALHSPSLHCRVAAVMATWNLQLQARRSWCAGIICSSQHEQNHATFGSLNEVMHCKCCESGACLQDSVLTEMYSSSISHLAYPSTCRSLMASSVTGA